jgi:hypothetical protein
MTEKKLKPKTGIKPLTKAFWALSRVRQEAFLKNLYDLSPQNKALFALRLGDDNSKVLTDLKKEVHKETLNRVGKFRKLRLAKINEILRNADKYALPMHQQIELKAEVWQGMVAFIISKSYLPERYQVAAARHLDQYLKMVSDHILEKSEVEERQLADKQLLLKLFEQGHYLPHVEEVYIKWFV